MNAWLALVVAGFFEIFWLIALKSSNGLSKLGPTLAFIAGAGASFWLLAVALKTIPMGTAYAIWTGIGAAGGAIAGMVMFHDPVTAIRISCIALIVAGVVGLKLWG